jgi:ubiquinone/menaquinone biosynthesis C-methylase UbiE
VEIKESDSSWKDWQTKLDIFQEWRKGKRNPIVRAWWAYLFSVFFHEISTLSRSAGLCLDVGCGSGGHLCRLVKEDGYGGIGLDPLKSSLTAFKDRIRCSGISEKVDLIRGVGEFLPLKNDCVQLCIMAGSLDHVCNPKQTLNEVYWVLAPESYFMLMETVLLEKKPSFYDDTHVCQFTLRDLERLLGQFRIERILKKVPIFSQIHVPDRLLDYSFLLKVLGRMPGTIGSCFNYSEVLIECKKN